MNILEDVDKALEAFYVDAIGETSDQTGIEEEIIRKWFEENLITSSGTRGIVHRGFESTGGLPNIAVDVLEKKYLIRKEERSGAQWYELTHDRFIKPILDSNKEWKDKLEQERQKTFADLWVKAVAMSKLQSGDTDQVLAAFYEKVIRKSIKKTRIGEDGLRSWCENKLITPGGTRGVVHKENSSIGGIPNKVADVLVEESLIRKEERSGAQWYELTHDRLVKPIKDSNRKWHEQRGKLRNSLFIKVILPCSIVSVIAISIFVYHLYVNEYDIQQQKQISQPQQQQQQQQIQQQQKVISQLLNSSYSLVLANPTAAITYLDKVLTIDPNNENALSSKGIALKNLGNYTQALPYLDKALAINPNNKYALNDKGYALNNLGNHTQAIQYYDKALAIDPKYTYALNGKGFALDNLGNHTQAIQYYDKALAIDPKYKDALYKGLALDTLGNHTEAIQYYDKYLAIDPTDKDALYNKASALANLGNYTQAIQYYDKALAIDPKYKDALYNKGLALDTLGNHTEAIQYYDKYLAIDPTDKDALNGKGNVFYNLGNYTQAIQYYNKALAIDPKYKDALNGKGNALNKLGNYTQASS